MRVFVLSALLLFFFQTDRLNKLIEELTEKLEASELQLSTISNSYRAQLNLREVSAKVS